jgi:hypothetical protein
MDVKTEAAVLNAAGRRIAYRFHERVYILEFEHVSTGVWLSSSVGTSRLGSLSETHGEVNHRLGATLSAGSQTVLSTVRFSPATSVAITAAANNLE